MSGYLQTASGILMPETNSIERYRIPVNWNDLVSEQPWEIKAKRNRAEQVGGIAIIADERAVDGRISDMAAYERAVFFDQIASQQIMYLSLLNGGAKFGQQFIDLVANGRKYQNETPIHPLSAFLHIATRDGDQEIREAEIFNRLKVDDGHDVNDKDVVILDDGTDTGTSMNAVADLLLDEEKVIKHGFGSGPARSVSARFLTDKGISQLDSGLIVVENIVVGFNCPVVWLGGMGFDGRDHKLGLTDVGRNLRELILTRVQNVRYKENMADAIKILGKRTKVTDIEKDFEWIDPETKAA